MHRFESGYDDALLHEHSIEPDSVHLFDGAFQEAGQELFQG